jgi:CrcB protein
MKTFSALGFAINSGRRRKRVTRMQNYFWVALGGALGTIGRYWCSGLVARLIGESFPWGTLMINVLGSFVIGFVAALTGPHGRQFVGTTGRQFVMVGICGGYTTFSSFSLQTLNLANHDEWLMAGANVCLSVVVCLVAVSIGYTLATAIGPIRWI